MSDQVKNFFLISLSILITWMMNGFFIQIQVDNEDKKINQNAM